MSEEFGLKVTEKPMFDGARYAVRYPDGRFKGTKGPVHGVSSAYLYTSYKGARWAAGGTSLKILPGPEVVVVRLANCGVVTADVEDTRPVIRYAVRRTDATGTTWMRKAAFYGGGRWSARRNDARLYTARGHAENALLSVRRSTNRYGTTADDSKLEVVEVRIEF